MNTPVRRKRKYCDENRVFNEQRNMQYLFIESNGKPLCLICQETISVVKEYNLKRHCKSRHETKYDNIRGQQREDKIQQLTKSVSRQQTVITRLGGVDDSVKASYMIALDIAKNMKSFSDGNFIKDCIIHAAQCVSPKTVNDF